MVNTTKYKIPKQYTEFIKEIYQDKDGICCILNEGYHFMSTGTILSTKNSINELKKNLKMIGKH